MNNEYILAVHNRLEGDRIVLRPFQLSDAEDMYEYASDAETTTYVFDPHKDLEETKNTIAKFFLADPLGRYAIELKENHKMIGSIDLRIDAEDKKAEIGYALNKQYWNQGYTTEASKLVLQLGFEELGLQRIFSLHDKRNAASGKVLEKIGMSHEGTFRNNRVSKGDTVTDKYYAITKEDYFSE